MPGGGGRRPPTRCDVPDISRSDPVTAPALTGLWPYAHVADVQRSIDFYARLGLEVRDTHDHEGRLVWAFLASSDSAGLMLALAGERVDPHAQAVLFYCWAPDIAALREELVRDGVEVGEVTHPFYMPAGEIRVADPDGYVLLVGQLRE